MVISIILSTLIYFSAFNGDEIHEYNSYEFRSFEINNLEINRLSNTNLSCSKLVSSEDLKNYSENNLDSNNPMLTYWFWLGVCMGMCEVEYDPFCCEIVIIVPEI